MNKNYFSKLKKYCKNPRAFYFYSNRAVRNPDVRNALYLLVRLFKPKVAVPAAAREDAARLKKDGIITWERLMAPSTADTIRHYLLEKPVYDFLEGYSNKGQTPLNLNELKITRQMKLKYFDADIAQCKEIVELANSEKILSIVSAYLGCKPTIALMSAWWTKAGTGPSETFYDDMFHRDVADYKFLKLFVYLNDVGPNNGAHCFVRGSHLFKKLTQRRTFSDEEINRNFSKEDQLILTGKSGCGFLEDTWGLHRSLPCTQGERLVLHIMYNLAAFDAGSPPKPLAENIYNVDPYTNRVYLF